MEPLKKCLVSRWGIFIDQALDVVLLKNRVVYNWQLKGNLHLALLRGSLILIKFESVFKVERVLHTTLEFSKGKILQLDRWVPKVGRFLEGVCAKEV